MTRAERNEFLKQHEGLPIWFLNKYVNQRPWSRRFLDSHRDDLLQELRLGMIRAADGYDPSKSSFAHWAIQWMRASLETYLVRQAGPVGTQSKEAKRTVTVPKASTHTATEHLRAASVPSADESEDVDSAEVFQTAVDALCQRLRGTSNPHIRATAFLEHYFADVTWQELSKRYGMNRETLRLWAESASEAFDSWSARVREEAA